MRDSIAAGIRVPSTVALALLESLRAVDTPGAPEFEDQDLPSPLPRRLGLSPAVGEQIERYARLRGRRDALPVEEVASLFRLIGRRPDAGRVFAEAGRRLAAHRLRGSSFPAGLRASALPAGARRRLALRRIRRIAREVNPGADVRVERRPPGLVVRSCLAATAAAGSEGCALLTGAIASVLEAYGAGPLRVLHPVCEGRAEDRCVWKALDQEPEDGGSSASA